MCVCEGGGVIKIMRKREGAREEKQKMIKGQKKRGRGEEDKRRTEKSMG